MLSRPVPPLLLVGRGDVVGPANVVLDRVGFGSHIYGSRSDEHEGGFHLTLSQDDDHPDAIRKGTRDPRRATWLRFATGCAQSSCSECVMPFSLKCFPNSAVVLKGYIDKYHSFRWASFGVDCNLPQGTDSNADLLLLHPGGAIYLTDPVGQTLALFNESFGSSVCSICSAVSAPRAHLKEQRPGLNPKLEMSSLSGLFGPELTHLDDITTDLGEARPSHFN